MLSPPAQLKVDKFPHHKGLCEADGGQDSYPNKKDVKVSCGPIETLVLSCGEAKAHGEDRQGQGEQPSEDKQDRPNGETQLPVLIAEVDQTGNVEQKLDKVMTHKEDQTQAVQV